MAPTLAALWSRHTCASPPPSHGAIAATLRAGAGTRCAQCPVRTRGKTRHVTSGLPAGVTKISQNKRVRVGVDPRVTETNLETDMKTIVLVLSLIALAAPAQAALKTQSRHDSQSLEQKCREMVGKEQYEGEGRSHIGQMQAQRFSDCMIGMPN